MTIEYNTCCNTGNVVGMRLDNYSETRFYNVNDTFAIVNNGQVIQYRCTVAHNPEPFDPEHNETIAAPVEVTGIASIVPGNNISVDDSDPQNPIISATGGGASYEAGDNITIENNVINAIVPEQIEYEAGDNITIENNVINAIVPDVDAAITAAIDTEVSNRDTAINTAIEAEETARDSAIETAVADEADNRNTAITSAINTEVSNRNTAINTAINTVNAKIPNQYGGVTQANGHNAGYMQTNIDFSVIGSNVAALGTWWYTDSQSEETFTRIMPNASETYPGIMSPEDKIAIRELKEKVDSHDGSIYYLDNYNFGTDTPTAADLTAHVQSVTGAGYNASYYYGIVNSFDGHEWIFNPLDSTWSDFGMSAITLATNNSYGIVKGDATTPYKVNVDADSTMSVNQLPELAASVATIGSQVNGLATSKADNSSLATVAKSGSYSDLSNKPTIPTVSYPVTSVAAKTGAVTLAKADVGLGNVDNTADANKPVSTAQQTAITAVANDSLSKIAYKNNTFISPYIQIERVSNFTYKFSGSLRSLGYLINYDFPNTSGSTTAIDGGTVANYTPVTFLNNNQGIQITFASNNFLIYRPGLGLCTAYFSSYNFQQGDNIIGICSNGGGGLPPNNHGFMLWNSRETVNVKTPILGHGYLEDVTKMGYTPVPITQAAFNLIIPDFNAIPCGNGKVNIQLLDPCNYLDANGNEAQWGCWDITSGSVQILPYTKGNAQTAITTVAMSAGSHNLCVRFMLPTPIFSSYKTKSVTVV